MPLIRIDSVSTVFGPRPAQALQRARDGVSKAELQSRHGHTLALREVSLDIDAGEIFVIMGLSGSGKSTLLRHINRLVEPTAGRVFVEGQDVMVLSRERLVQLRRERLAMVFQRFALLPHRDVLHNVAFSRSLRGDADAAREAMRWIERVGLGGLERQMPTQLSGGMQQRVGLARALCAGTDILLMDEPFSALDPLLRTQMQAELLQLQAELGRCIVFITHDLDEALRLGDRIAVLDEGRLRQVGTPAQLLDAPADAHVAAFVRDVNRARAWCAGDALQAWPDTLPAPPLEEAVDAAVSLEHLLPRLLGDAAAPAVRRDGRIVGRLDLARVRALLAPPPR